MAPYVSNTHSSAANPQVVCQLCNAQRLGMGWGGPARPGTGARRRLPRQPQTHTRTQRKRPHCESGSSPPRRCTRWNVPPALQASTPESAHVCRRPPDDRYSRHTLDGALSICGFKCSSEDVKKEARKRAKPVLSVSDFR